MKVRMTAEQKQSKLDLLAENYTDAAIKMASRPELLEWCEGIVPSLKTKRKDELASALVKLLKETRQRIANKIADEPSAIQLLADERKTLATEYEDPAYDVADRLYKQLAVAAQDSETAEELTDKVFTAVTRLVTSELRKYKPASIRNRKTRICKLLRAVSRKKRFSSKKSMTP